MIIPVGTTVHSIDLGCTGTIKGTIREMLYESPFNEDNNSYLVSTHYGLFRFLQSEIIHCNEAPSEFSFHALIKMLKTGALPPEEFKI